MPGMYKGTVAWRFADDARTDVLELRGVARTFIQDLLDQTRGVQGDCFRTGQWQYEDGIISAILLREANGSVRVWCRLEREEKVVGEEWWLPGLFLFCEGEEKFLFEPNPKLPVRGALIGKDGGWRLLKDPLLPPGSYRNGVCTVNEARPDSSRQVAMVCVKEDGSSWAYGYGAQPIGELPWTESESLTGSCWYLDGTLVGVVGSPSGGAGTFYVRDAARGDWSGSGMSRVWAPQDMADFGSLNQSGSEFAYASTLGWRRYTFSSGGSGTYEFVSDPTQVAIIETDQTYPVDLISDVPVISGASICTLDGVGPSPMEWVGTDGRGALSRVNCDQVVNYVATDRSRLDWPVTKSHYLRQDLVPVSYTLTYANAATYHLFGIADEATVVRTEEWGEYCGTGLANWGGTAELTYTSPNGRNLTTATYSRGEHRNKEIGGRQLTGFDGFLTGQAILDYTIWPNFSSGNTRPWDAWSSFGIFVGVPYWSDFLFEGNYGQASNFNGGLVSTAFDYVTINLCAGLVFKVNCVGFTDFVVNWDPVHPWQHIANIGLGFGDVEEVLIDSGASSISCLAGQRAIEIDPSLSDVQGRLVGAAITPITADVCCLFATGCGNEDEDEVELETIELWGLYRGVVTNLTSLAFSNIPTMQAYLKAFLDAVYVGDTVPYMGIPALRGLARTASYIKSGEN
jgi:hypothetical protein